MKDKIMSYISCVSIFQPNLQRSFGTASPVNTISGPPNTPVLYSWAGSISYTSLPSIAFGTLERWRPDHKDSIPLNRDQWVLWSTGTANFVRIKEVDKLKIFEHWSNQLPTEIQNNSPQWVNTYISQKLLTY